MHQPLPDFTPLSLTALTSDHPLRRTDGEVARLARLAAAGVPVAPLRIVPAAAEETFYRLNNLPAQLNSLFAPLDPTDPDEDDVEEMIPEARALLERHYLLEEFIDTFYTSLHTLPERLSVRRPDHPQAHEAVRGRPTLLALKHLWLDDWTLKAVMTRLEQGGSIALQAAPVIITAAGRDAAPHDLQTRADTVLASPVRLLVDSAHGVTGALTQS